MSRSLRVPLFPLPGAILFPRSQLPLHIFEPRYREMVKDAIDGAGHLPHIEQAATVDSILVRFLELHAGRGAGQEDTRAP